MRIRLTEVPGIQRPRRPEGSGEQPTDGQPGAVAGGGRRTAPDEHMRALTVRGRVLRVAVRGGNPQWPPLVLCNGIGARLELLQPFVDAVDAQREVVRFDMPGIGGSPEPGMPYHLWTLAPLLSGLLDQLGYRQADVLGISWGGGLAQQFAVRDPARVHRLVLVATATGALMVPGHPRVLWHMLTPRRHRDAAHAAAIAGEIYGGSMRAGASRISELLHAAARPGPGRGYYYQLLAAVGWTSLPLLPLIRQPTLILAGDDDPLTPLANARIMHRLIPRSELNIYHGGHLDLVSEPERMAAIVESFLAAGTGSATGSADGPPGIHRRQAKATP
jgi:poly(3-hydroxyalkanoate) depolymerase